MKRKCCKCGKETRKFTCPKCKHPLCIDCKGVIITGRLE